MQVHGGALQGPLSREFRPLGASLTTQPNREHELDFPDHTQVALAASRALLLAGARATPHDAQPSDEWHRGAYLVRGLGPLHGLSRQPNSMGANDSAGGLAGGMLPGGKWYAPELDAASESGAVGWPTDEVVTLLKTGRTAHASVTGPMAAVV